MNVKESDNLPKSSEHPTNEDDNVRWTSGKPEELLDKKPIE